MNNKNNPDLPLVSIVTPSLNQGQFIRQTIESVLSQDYAHLEYWVIDGGSNDGTLEILRNYGNDPRFYWLSEPDQGQAHAINKGWQQCRGEFIAWLNSDDAYCPHAIDQAVEALINNSQAPLVCGSALVVDETGKQIGHIPAPYLSLEKILQMRAYLPQPAVFLRATVVKQVGGLNVDLQYAMDYDLFLRLAAIANPIYVDHNLAKYRWHQNAKTATSFYKLRKEAAQVNQQFLRSYSTTLSSTKNRQLLGYAYLVEAYADFRLGWRKNAAKRLAKGLRIYPLNIYWIIKRLFKHNEHPFDTASS